MACAAVLAENVKVGYGLAGFIYAARFARACCCLNLFVILSFSAEAAAYAQWADARLPTEFEWEAASNQVAFDGRFLDPSDLQPHAAVAVPMQELSQMYGDVWQWTRSSYDPYPGFKPLAGAVGEYNGKFMVGQIVLRGGSCATPAGHMRPSYRNFFPPGARWQFSGLRLARDV